MNPILRTSLLSFFTFFTFVSFGQTKNVLNQFLEREINLNVVLQQTLPDGKKFYYSRRQATHDFNLYSEFPFDFWAKRERLVERFLVNIFDESDIILIDSSYIITLVDKYNEFNVASNKIGEPQYFRPDCSIKNLIVDLARESQQLDKLYKLWTKTTDNLYQFRFWSLESRDREGYLRPSDRMDTLIPMVIPIIKQLEKDREIAESEMNNQFIVERMDHLTYLLKLFHSQYATKENKKVTKSVLDSASLVWQYTNYYGNLLHDQRVSMGSASKTLIDVSSKQKDQQYALLRLLSVDQNVNYDTGFISNRTAVLQEWLNSMGVNSLLTLSDIRMNATGKFAFHFFEEESNSDSLYMINFLRQYNPKAVSTPDEIRNEFTSRIFFTISSLFHLPLEQLDVYVHGGVYETEIIKYKESKIISVIPPCSTCMAETVTIIHKDECMSNTSLARSFFVNGSKRMEMIIYNALLRYFQSKNCKQDSWKRIKVENGEVIVWLNNARKIVLENEGYWENILYRFKISKEQSGVKLDLITYGEFGTGIVIGELGKPPSYSAYKPMEPKFTTPLQNYCSDVLYKIKDLLTQ